MISYRDGDTVLRGVFVEPPGAAATAGVLLVHGGAGLDDHAREQAGLAVLTAHPRVDGRAAAVGYCFGGTTVLEMARAGAPVAGVASVHGGLRRRRAGPVAPIAARVLACHGGADPHVPPAEVA